MIAKGPNGVNAQVDFTFEPAASAEPVGRPAAEAAKDQPAADGNPARQDRPGAD